MTFIYRIYQLIFALPIILIITIITALTVLIGCNIGNGDFWGYHPGKIWSRLVVGVLLLPVKVEGQENLKENESYVFVSNHQGAFDIFLIYGYLGRNFKWIMKRQIHNIPLVGQACQAANHIFVDKRSATKILHTYTLARNTLKDGMSLVVFPEGARTFTGHMGIFKRGAFMLADELKLPVVPITINGSFDVKPRTKDLKWVTWHPLKLTLHKPIYIYEKEKNNATKLSQLSYNAIMKGLETKYQGFVENPDQ